MSAYVEIEALTKWYKQATEPAVKELSLNILQGEIYGLLGPNGAGKTTTISILCNQIEANSGTIRIAGRELRQHREGLKKIIGVVPQEIALYPTLTALENLRFFGSMYGLRGNSLDERIVQCMQDFGLEQKMNSRVNTFSGGMKRRVNLIAGILHKPSLLVLDEPTVGVDVQSKTVIIDHLLQMRETEGTTILYTSHMMDEAERFCSRIGIIDLGVLIAGGEPKKMIETYTGCETLEDIYLLLTGRNLRD